MFLFVANFSSVKTYLECKGNYSSNGQITQTKLFVSIDEYRWWVGLWSNSDGNMRVEIEEIDFLYYSYLDDIDSFPRLHIYDSDPARGGKGKGYYSKLSKTLKLYFTSKTSFEGKCYSIN